MPGWLDLGATSGCPEGMAGDRLPGGGTAMAIRCESAFRHYGAATGDQGTKLSFSGF